MVKIQAYFTFVLLMTSQVVMGQKVLIKELVDSFYAAMEQKDTVVLEDIMHPDCRIFSTLNKNGQPRVEALQKASLLGFMKRAIDKKYIYHQKRWTYDIQIEDNLATSRSEYTLFTGKVPVVSHCGVAVFTLFQKSVGTWQILNISDTRREEDCLVAMTALQQEQVVDSLLDAWHRAAAQSVRSDYTRLLADNVVYARPDSIQYYPSDGVKGWLSTYFEQLYRWQLRPLQRKLYVSPNTDLVWFEEQLESTVGRFRATGILYLHLDGWKLQYYALNRLIPVSLVPKLSKLVEKSTKKNKN